MQNAIETIRQHRTYRHFKAGLALPETDVQTSIDCARQAPSWMNGQHYSIINITDPALRAQIVALQPGNPQIGTCSTYLLFIADLHRAGLASHAFQGSFNAAGEPDSLITAVTDTSLAAQNALVAAESLGYATCFTGGIRLIAPQLIELLGLPESSVYAENHYPPEQTLIEGLAQYEQTMSAFSEAREKLPYREKFARYYSNTYAPKNIPLLQQQGWLIKFE